MRPVLSREQMRAFDRSAIEAGVPSLVLMENAGRGAAHLIGLKLRPRREGEAPRSSSALVGACIRCADERSLWGAEVLILVGSGNNGGDGCVVARHLALRGSRVVVATLATREAFGGDARLALQAMEAVGVPLVTLPEAAALRELLSGSPLIVDALLGTGLGRPLTGENKKLVELVNDSSLPVIALDLPTGLDANTGEVHAACVKADHTVTFAHLKQGLLTTNGHLLAGRVTVSHIGVPATLDQEVEPSAWLLEESDLRSMISPRSGTEHKGTAGRVGLLAGGPGTLGAARLAARGALRAGAGLLTVVSDPETITLLESEVEEIMTRPLLGSTDEDEEFYARCDALVLGPGLGADVRRLSAIEGMLASQRPCILDADALRWLARLGSAAWRTRVRGPVALTPHPAEAAALLGTSVAEVEKDRFSSARRLSEDFEAIVVLKGSRTLVVAPGETTLVCAFGTPALATGGTGDVLAGVLGALVAHAPDPAALRSRVAFGVSVHALAGEMWAGEHGDRGLLAHELADLVPQVVKRLVSDPLTS